MLGVDPFRASPEAQPDANAAEVLLLTRKLLEGEGPAHVQWEFQDPKMKVLYHIGPYFGGISPYIALTWALYMVGTSNLGS